MVQKNICSTGTATTTCNIQKILQLLDETKAKIILSKNKSVILLLGDTGSGKSTLAHFICKDNSKLKSIETSPGQFLLIDDENKISHNTTVSETIIPQLVEDIHSNTALYDCPGFRDTRNSTIDIVNAYSIHAIWEDAEQFKIVFVLSYHSVKDGVDRHAFIDLIKNASKLITNIQKYDKSIAAVITKVDNIPRKRGNSYELISDNDILHGIENFLQKVKSEIPQNASHYNTGIALINILLEKDDGNFKRLALFRRPDEKGLISDTTKFDLLHTEKHTIHRMFNENIIFTKKSVMDFGYTISEESKNDIFYLVEEINSNITKSIILIGNEIIKQYRTFEEGNTDFIKKIDKFNKAQLEFKSLKDQIKKNHKLSQIVDSLKEFSKDLHIPKDHFDSILNHESNLKFLSKVSGSNFQPKSIELESSIEPLLKYLNDSKEWYIFLCALYSKLTEYDIQKDTTKLNINDLQTLYNTWMRQNVDKKGSDFRTLFEHIYSTEIGNGQLVRNYSSIEDVHVDNIKLRKFLYVLSYTLENDVKYQKIDSTKIRIKGKFINLSKIMSEIAPTNIKNIEIFAVNKISIDKNINFVGEKRKIFIAAQEWNIINTREINLDGNAGSPHAALQAQNDADGLPGLPGGIAGTFFGIADQCINSESLTITANGGNGGPGQNGGKGGQGSNGENPKLPAMKWFTGRGANGEEILKTLGYKNYKNLSDNTDKTVLEATGSVLNTVQGVGEKVITGQISSMSVDSLANSLKKSFETFGNSIKKMPQRVVTTFEDLKDVELKDIKALFHICDESVFEIYGTDGVQGNNGGNGGAGGLGGKSGKINLFTLKNILTRLGYESKNGENGVGGRGGKGGEGGVHGECLTAKFINYKTPMVSKAVPMLPAQGAGFAVDIMLPSDWSEESRTSRGSAESGKNGITSLNSVDQLEPEKNEIKIDALLHIFNDYIAYLKENTEKSVKKDSLLQFLEKLNSNTDITKVY